MFGQLRSCTLPGQSWAIRPCGDGQFCGYCVRAAEDRWSGSTKSSDVLAKVAQSAGSSRYHHAEPVVMLRNWLAHGV